MNRDYQVHPWDSYTALEDDYKLRADRVLPGQG